jgi:hypothetical protein
MAIDLTRITKLHVGLVGATGGLSYATHCGAPGSVLLGGAVMGVNFWLLRVVTNVLRPSVLDANNPGRAAAAMAALTLKFGLFLGLLGMLFWRVPVEGMSFAVGVTLLLVACLLEVARAELYRKGVG